MSEQDTTEEPRDDATENDTDSTDTGAHTTADGTGATETAGEPTESEGVSARTDPIAAAPDDSILEVRDLDAGYGDLQILEEVDLDVGDGEYITVVGPNGAGKSTVMKSVFGLTTYMGGSIVFEGEEIHQLPPEKIIYKGISYVPQNDNIFPTLSVEENLEMGAYILDEVPQERLREVYDRFPILEERKAQKAGSMSGGQRQMVAMGRALMLDPDLLLLDEPSAGLAPDLVEDMFDRIDRINDDGTAILMVEQNAKEALRRCDRGYVLAQGRNGYVDTGDRLLADEEVRQQFLGG